MENISLAVYMVRVKGKKDNKYCKLENIDGANFLDILSGYFTSRKKISSNPTLMKAINLKNIKFQSSNYFHGTLETGNFGFMSNIKDVGTGKLNYVKKSNEAEMIPFFFIGYIPNNSYKGIIILERFRTYGVKTIFEEDFNNYLNENKIEVRFSLHALLPEKVARQYFDCGNVRKVRLVKHMVPKDIADTYNESFRNGEFGSFEYVINSRKNKALPFKDPIIKFLDKAIGLKNIIEIEDFEYDNIKVEIDIKGKKRTLNLRNFDKLSGYIDISEEVQLETDGHPKYESIKKISLDFIETYKETIDFSNPLINAGILQENELKDETENAI